MNFAAYQKLAKETRAYPEYGQSTMGAIGYCALGLAGEAGEVANKVKKLLRDGDTPELRMKILDEIGDTLWYAAMLTDELKGDFSLVASANLKKLDDRKRNNRIRGEGDDRQQSSRYEQPESE